MTTKYRHKLLNNSVTFGTPVICQFDLQCGNLTASALYGGAATQIQNLINTAVSTKQNTLQIMPGTGVSLLEIVYIGEGLDLVEGPNYIKKIFTVSPLEIKTYLNLNDANDQKNGNIEISVNKSALFNQLYHCGGIINSDGTIALTKGNIGFTSSKGGTGVYNITFNSPHPSSNYLVSTSINTNARVFLSCNNITNETIRFNGLNNNGTSTDVAFHFQVFL